MGKQVTQYLSDALDKEITYDPCTPAEFGRYLVEAAGDTMPEEMREEFALGIQAFYEYNNEAPTRPFEVDMEHVYERFPELDGKRETLGDWTKRQEWGESNFRPAFG